MIDDPQIFIRLLAAVIAGGLIGYERKHNKKPAGLRTQILVCMSACLVTIAAVVALPQYDASRVIAGVVTGIGFLGAGTIFRAKDHVAGLTTAASTWAVAAIGIVIGIGEYYLAAAATVLCFIVLRLYHYKFFRNL